MHKPLSPFNPNPLSVLLPPPQSGRKSRTNNEYEINATPESRCSCTRSVPVRLQIETSTSQCCDRQARGDAPLDRGGWGIKGDSGYCRRCPGRRLLTWTCIALSHRLIDRRLTGWRETDSSETGRKTGDEGGRDAVRRRYWLTWEKMQFAERGEWGTRCGILCSV